MRNLSCFTLECLTFAVLAVASELPSLADERPVSVCRVLSSLAEYRGKPIAVRAVLLGIRSSHGWFIQDYVGDQPCANVTKQGHAWPPAISLAQWRKGQDLDDPEEGPPSIESDVIGITASLADAQLRSKSDPSLTIIATFVGELRSKLGIEIRRTDEGWYEGNGYGQSGQYPALLVLKEVRDVKVVSRKNREPR